MADPTPEEIMRDNAAMLKLKMDTLLPIISTALPQLARLAKVNYDAYVNAGFTEAQALLLTGQFMQQFLNQPKQD